MSCVALLNAISQKNASDSCNHISVCSVSATPASAAPTSICITSIHQRFVFRLSTIGLHSGFITHGRYSHEVYSAISVFDSPMLVYITVDKTITIMYGKASAKYSDGTHEAGCVVFLFSFI